MKLSFYAIGMLMLIVSGQASAQNTETSFITMRSVMNSPFVTNKSATVAAVVTSVRVLERFHKEYQNAKDVEWTEVPDGYRASFLQDAELTVVDYTRKGKLMSVIRYGEHLLSPYMKMKLGEIFDGLQIREVAEVKMAGFPTKAFVVVLEDKTALKTVQMIEDGISVIYEMKK